MEWRACTMVLLVALLPGCSSSDTAADAGGTIDAPDAIDGSVDSGSGADAEPLCDSSHPGVHLHVTVTFESPSCSYAWDREALGLATTGPNGAQLSKRFTYGLGPQAAPFTATTTLGYPEGTVAGPAAVGFYAINANLNWEGSTAFTADPAACVDVDLAVRCYAIGSSDAGPRATPR